MIPVQEINLSALKWGQKQDLSHIRVAATTNWTINLDRPEKEVYFHVHVEAKRFGPRWPIQKCCKMGRIACTHQARASGTSGWFPVALVRN